MDLFPVTIAIFVVLHAIGIAASYLAVAVRWPAGVRIQQRGRTAASLTGRLPLILFNVALLMTLTLVGMVVMRDQIIREGAEPWRIALQIGVFFVVDDVWFYWIHRKLHTNRRLYRWIHKLHHRAYCPLPIEYIYVHPAEWMLGAAAVSTVLVGFAFLGGGLCVQAVWGFHVLRVMHELDIHSGFRSVLGHRIPVYAEAEHHDLHHARPTLGNYGSTTLVWDTLFGTRVRSEDLARAKPAPER